jgi:endo-1,4-beta-xylanase
MRCPSNLILMVIGGIIPALSMGCGGSGLGPARDAGSSSTGGAGERTWSSGCGQNSSGGQPGGGSPLGGAGARGAIGGTTSALTSSGGETGGTGSTAIAGMPAGGTPTTGGPRTGGSTGGSSSGGVSAPGGTSALGGSAVAGKTSSTIAGGGTASGGTGGPSNPGSGGSSALGGVTATGGSRSGPSFPDRFVGNIDTRSAIPTDFVKYWDQFTPENAGKWMSVQGGGKDTFNWTALDAMYKYTEEHNIIFKEHCFIWGSAQASWINNTNALEAAKTWMKAFCDRYPKTRLIDVVNEPPPHTTPTYVNALGGGTRTTWDWVANSFKFAREACPNATLILNDYNICEYASDNQNIISLVKAIKVLDAPIDAVGCQAHDAAKIPVSKFKDFMNKIASETGLPIYITEYDIGLADDELQRAQYADYFTMFWDDPNLKGVTVWGYITGATWRANTGIMSSAGTMRPAMTWLMEFLKR